MFELRAAKLGAAFFRVAEMPLVYVNGSFSSDELTPLEEVYAPQIGDLPGSIQHPIRHEFWDRLGDASESEKDGAAAWVGKSVSDLVDAKLNIAFDSEVVEDMASRCARICYRLKTYEAMQEFADEQGITRRTRSGTDDVGSYRRGCMRRFVDLRFWRRELDKKLGRRAENGLRAAGFVHSEAGLYASNLAVSQRRFKSRRTNRWVKDRVCVSDSGDQIELWEVRQGSQANPVNRRNELMVRMRGFEEVADAAGHRADFYTLTTPSRFHARLDAGGGNPRFDDSTVREGQAWLCTMWARARAEFKRRGLLVYGFRIAEPHHDGTPHWHMVLFTLAHRRRRLRSVLRKHWLSDGGSDPGAQIRRITVKAIDAHKGSAAGYLAKYVAKNIDGFEVGDDFEAKANTKASDSCERVTAWATRHGIRQFQQIGGPSVTVYRELRRLRSEVSVAAIEAARVHADAGEWAEFIRVIGGIAAGRQGKLSLWTEVTGEINQYDELRGPQIVGVEVSGTVLHSKDSGVLTREKGWRIVKKTPGLSLSDLLSSLGPVSITVRGGGGVGAPSAWTNPNESSMYGPH